MKTLALISFVALLSAQSYENYPANEPYAGKNAPLILEKTDREFRTMLRSAATKKPNFASHYILTEWGCGGGCVMGAVIDANTGRVYQLPHTICCWPANINEPIAYRLDSRLIVFSGARNEKEGDEGTHYYEFRDGMFVLVKSVLTKKQ